jgi:hypothetical protein
LAGGTTSKSSDDATRDERRYDNEAWKRERRPGYRLTRTSSACMYKIIDEPCGHHDIPRASASPNTNFHSGCVCRVPTTRAFTRSTPTIVAVAELRIGWTAVSPVWTRSTPPLVFPSPFSFGLLLSFVGRLLPLTSPVLDLGTEFYQIRKIRMDIRPTYTYSLCLTTPP